MTTADNGSVALTILRERYYDFDVILTDLQMPIMDGLEFVRRVREYEADQQEKSVDEICSHMNNDVSETMYTMRPNDVKSEMSDIKINKGCLVIGMSANSDDETRREALLVGMDSFVAKPFNVAKFCDVLNSVRASRNENI